MYLKLYVIYMYRKFKYIALIRNTENIVII